jgi:internalin A
MAQARKHSVPEQMARDRIREATKQKATALDLSFLYIGKCPDEVSQLATLQSLNLSGNPLTALPESIARLTRLQHLDLSGNKLTALPESIDGLTNLRILVLYRNRLTSLPEGLKRLKGLERLFLHDNPALKLPQEILGPTWEDVGANRAVPAKPALILDYFFRTQLGHRPLGEAKLILVGRGGVGKSSLVERLVNDTFDSGKGRTEGIAITDWPFRLADGDEVRLHIWDFGGQEIMHATHQFFLTQRSLYLLVLSGRDGNEENDAEYWLRLIESFGADSPVIVVLNKIRELPFDINRRAIQAKYPGIRAFIKTDCEDRTGIDELHKCIRSETDRLENLRARFPASWFTIKDGLPGTKKNYLTYSEYREFCRGHGESDCAAQDALAGYLHILGIALNYKDDARLRDHHVLNPHWVTIGVYKLLNAPLLHVTKGELRLSDVEGLLDVASYPREMHRFLLDLMKKFELCFSFPEDTKYLVPELLDMQEPAEAARFRPEECLNFQYHYPVVPEGLLPRFIVRTHVLSEGQPRWKTGVILQFEGACALVKADAAEKKVVISVSGPSATVRRNLLAIIRSDFDQIHRDIPRLDPQEMVPVPGHPNVVLEYKELLVLEAEGEIELKKVIAGKVERLEISELLNGVDFEDERTRRRDRSSGRPEAEFMDRLRLFFSYSHRDEELRNQLATHLKLLERQGVIDLWHDRMIGAGEEWKGQISDNLEKAEIVLLLVSSDFIASDYCYDIEMQRALRRHEAGEARVIPVIVRDVDWSSAPFGKLQALPKDGKAVTLWPDRDSAWKNVSEGIKRAAEAMRRRRR